VARRHSLVAAVVWVVVLSVALTAVVGATAATGVAAPAGDELMAVGSTGAVTSFQSADSACADHDSSRSPVVRVLLPNGTVLQENDRMDLYPGSEVRVVACGDGQAKQTGSEWTLSPNAGFEVGKQLKTGYEVTITRTEGTVELVAGIEQTTVESGAAPTIRTPSGYVARSTVSGLQIRFKSAAARDRYVQARNNYTTVHGKIIEKTESLNSTSNASKAKTIAADLNQSSSDLRDARQELQVALFRPAMNGNESAVKTIDELEDNQSATETRLRGGLSDGYELEGPGVSLLLQFLGPLLAGLLLGAGGSWVYTDRELQDAVRRRQYSSSVSMGLTRLKIQLATGAVLLLIGLGVLVVTGSLTGLVQGVLL
jgi:hypothetical protein